jgi:hypothetical protein
MDLLATCKDIEFKFTLIPATEEKDLYIHFPRSAAQVRKKDLGPKKIRTKDIYEKTIENVLGIQIEN